LTASAVVAHGSFALDDFAAAVSRMSPSGLLLNTGCITGCPSPRRFARGQSVAPRLERMMRRQK